LQVNLNQQQQFGQNQLQSNLSGFGNQQQAGFGNQQGGFGNQQQISGFGLQQQTQPQGTTNPYASTQMSGFGQAQVQNPQGGQNQSNFAQQYLNQGSVQNKI